jgi:hypothetical protein
MDDLYIGTVLVRPKLAGTPHQDTVLLRATPQHWTDGRHQWKRGDIDVDANSGWVQLRLIVSSIRLATVEERQQHEQRARINTMQTAQERVDHLRRVLRYAEQDVGLAQARRDEVAEKLRAAESALLSLV